MPRTPEVGGGKISRRRFIGLVTGGMALTAASLAGGILVAQKVARDKSGSGPTPLPQPGLPPEGGGVAAAGGQPPSLGELAQAGIKQSQEGIASVVQPADSELSRKEKVAAPYEEYYEHPEKQEPTLYVRFDQINQPGPALMTAVEGSGWWARPSLRGELEKLVGRSLTNEELSLMRKDQAAAVAFLKELFEKGVISKPALDFYSQTPEVIYQQVKKVYPKILP